MPVLLDINESNLFTKVLIRHRASDESFRLVEKIMSCFGSKMVYLTAAKHDRITADTQAVTHAAFLRYVAEASSSDTLGSEAGTLS